MVASEDKMSRLESDLALIADQEKSIVTQLAHIDSSKQKLKTIIENTADADFDALEERKKQYVNVIFLCMLSIHRQINTLISMKLHN